MRRTFLIPALVITAALATTCHAQSTPAPPDWQDQAETSVYAGIKQQAGGAPPVAAPIPQLPAPENLSPAEQSLATMPAPATTHQPAPAATATANKTDTGIVLAAHQEPVAAATPAVEDHRRLAPPSSARTRLANRATDGSDARSALANRVPSFGLPTNSIFTVVSALGIVLGAFLIFAWALRRGNRRPGSSLPTEVVSVLGRVPLAGRRFAELLRVGNKLVLISLTPGGIETITEVTDPTEVDRLTGLCQQESPHSTTKAFEHVFQQLSRETTPSNFLSEPSLPTTISAAAEAYRSHRGATARA